MKNKSWLIIFGALNLLHGISHIVQFFQSLLLVSFNYNQDKDSWWHKVFDHPIFGLIWAIIGVISLVTGIRDYIYHKKHNEHHCKH
jgi:hypothetical protein